ncbi:MAG: tetratricopeptide repeat protein, partial [Holophagales bacterium]|nr:tetratricopeptide repeat protein [Holophagales bacterium]
LLDRYREIYGPESAEAAKALNNLGSTLAAGGRWAEAEATLRESLDVARPLLGPHHPSLDNTARNLAYVLEFRGRYADAEGLLRPIVAAGGEADPRGALLTEIQLAGLKLRMEGPKAAIGVLEVLAARLESVHPPPDLILLSAPQRLLAEAYLKAGRYQDSEHLFRWVLDRVGGVYASGHPLTAHAACGVASALAGQGRHDEARGLFRDCLDVYSSWGWANPATVAAYRGAAAAAGGLPDP